MTSDRRRRTRRPRSAAAARPMMDRPTGIVETIPVGARPEARRSPVAMRAASVARPRGVYVEPCEVPGKVLIVVHDSTGEEVNCARLSVRVVTRHTRAAFDAWLDDIDPPALRIVR